MALTKVNSGGINFSTGKVLQVVSSVNKYQHTSAGAANTYYTMLSASGTDWTPSITIAANSKILVDFNISMALSASDPFILMKLQRKIDSGSWADVDVGSSNGNRIPVMNGLRIRAESNYGQIPVRITYLYDPAQSSSCTVSFKKIARQGAGTTRAWVYNYAETNVTEAGTFLSHCSLTEVSS